ncbi:MAG: serine/threonine-protein kinase, partial [Planctomycetia bacterium]
MRTDTVQEASRRLTELGLVSLDELKDVLVEAPADGRELADRLQRRGLLTSFQIQKLERGEKNGYFMGRFKLLYMVSAGTFARVYRGIDSTTGAGVAVKVLRTRHTVDPEAIRRFEREARLTQPFDHPNITRTLEVDQDALGGAYYIAMEFVEGGNLREFLGIRKTISPAETVRMGLGMVDGLRYALSLGVTHRDIKPTNILIASSGAVKWVDFGLAGVVEGQGQKQNFSTEQRTVDYA